MEKLAHASVKSIPNPPHQHSGRYTLPALTTRRDREKERGDRERKKEREREKAGERAWISVRTP